MPEVTLRPNTFTSYNLTDEDELQGSIMTITQLQVLQNELSSLAEEKLALMFDPEHPMVFMQQEAHAKGKIEMVQFLIEKSESSAINLAELRTNRIYAES